jgi:transcriptional regulator with AAA-type ATPase domain
MKLDKNHDGFLDSSEIATALTLLSKYAKFSGFGGFVPIVCGKSSKAQKLRKDVIKAANDPARNAVVIVGESGLEKETIATLIHEIQGIRNGHLLYRVHCDSNSLEELFGTESRPGLLDQLSQRVDSVLVTNLEALTLPSELEDLKVLFESKTYFSRFHKDRRMCDARFLAVSEKVPDVFRDSSNITNIAVAPLKQRSSDLPLIANTVLKRITKRRGKPTLTLAKDALHRIKAYGWPDNLREVGSALERALYIFEADRREHPFIPFALTCDHVFTSPAEVSTEFLRYNLLSRMEWLHDLVRSPIVFDDFIRYVVPPVFVATLAMLFIGPQTRDSNAALTVFWAWWWPLGLLSYPLLSRMWCAVCPFMATGELVQQAVKATGAQLRSWPAEVKTVGPPFAYGLFAGILMWEELWNLPDNGALSASLLLLITSGAVIGSALFEKRVWCRHLCPIGAMNGLYSKMAILEIRSPKGVCSGCTAPRCTQGGPIDQEGMSGGGCPLESSPSKLADNSNVSAI